LEFSSTRKTIDIPPGSGDIARARKKGGLKRLSMSKFELVINLAAAKALGLAVPRLDASAGR